MDNKESFKIRSEASCSTKTSRSSSTGAAAAMARAKAEAAKARLAFAEKEMSLKMEKAQLEAEMEKLSLEREAAAAVAEAETLEAAVDGSERSSRKLQLDEAPLNPQERTKEYIAEQTKEHSISALHLLTQDETGQLYTESTMAQHLPSQDEIRWQHAESTPAPHLSPQGETRHLRADPAPVSSIQAPQLKSGSSLDDNHLTHTAPKRETTHQPQLTPTMPLQPGKAHDHNSTYGARASNQGPPHPTMPSHAPQYAYHDQSSINDVVRYFARRELVTTGLTQFNDQPQSYRAWQQSFQNAVRGLNLTYSEEMDLLVKWLGKESSEHANRIRAVHVNHPDRGLRMI